MKATDIFDYLSDMLPYKKKSSLDWIVPASIGLSLGIACGVGIGVLIAPSSGEHTRRRLIDRAERVKDRALTVAQKAKGQLTHGANDLVGDRAFADVGEVR